MPKEYVREYYFDGGVNNTLADELIADNELADARNVHPSENGEGNIIKRCGVQAVSNGSTYPAGASWSSFAPIYVGENGAYYAESFTASGTDTFNIYKLGDGTVLKTNTTAIAGEPSWSSFSAYDIYCDTAHHFKTVDGTTFSDLANAPAAGFAFQPYNNYLFCIGSFTSGVVSLRWSALNDPETWPATYELKFNLNDQYDAPVGLVWQGECLYLFTLKRFYEIQGYGPLDFTVTHHSFGNGAALNQLISATPVGLFWWDMAKGLCSTANGRDIDYPMRRKLLGTYWDHIWTAFQGQMVWRGDREALSVYLWLNTGTHYNSTTRIDYYPRKDSFWIHTGTACSVMGAFYYDGIESGSFTTPGSYLTTRDAVAGTGKLYCRAEGTLLATDLGGSYSAYMLTKRRSDPLKSAFKTATKSFITTKFPSAGNFVYEAIQDNATASLIPDTVAVGSGVQDTEMGLNKQHRKLQHLIGDSESQRTEYLSIVEVGTLDKSN